MRPAKTGGPETAGAAAKLSAPHVPPVKPLCNPPCAHAQVNAQVERWQKCRLARLLCVKVDR